MTYSSLATTVRSLFLQPGVKYMPPFKVFSSTIPRRIFVALVDAKAFNGDLSTSPYVFKNYDLQNIRIQAGGETLPFNEFQCDYDKGLFARAYMSLQQTLGVANTGISNGITPDEFRRFCCVYGFDTSGYDPEFYGLQRIGECTISFSFTENVPAPGLYAIIMGESVSNLMIGADRVAHVY